MPFDGNATRIFHPQSTTEEQVELQPLSLFARIREWWCTVRPRSFISDVAPKPVDARVVALKVGLDAIQQREWLWRESKINDYVKYSPLTEIREAATSPAAYYGALEAIRAVTGHPVHAIGYAIESPRRNSCNMSCMTPKEVKSALKLAIQYIESNPSRLVR